MNFLIRIKNVFRNADIRTVSDILPYYKNDLLKLRGFGKKCIRELEDELRRIGIPY
jgi:DNA-directed RNA polymerase alpha subunit